MIAISNLWAPPQHAMSATAQAAANSSSASQAGSASTISANDFLTLLVTEMKNQDPTSTTDPNEYINQLVSVNSLEQLIQINQTLAAAVYLGSGGSAGSSTDGSTNQQAGQNTHVSRSGSDPVAAASPIAGVPVGSIAAGNLGTPSIDPAALRIAQALSGGGRGNP
jgi:flagellar basal-body rod modification protein FlgD